MTLKTHPSPRIDTALFIVQADDKAPHFADIVSYLVSQIPELMDKGLSGYCYVATAMPNPIPDPSLPKLLSGVFGATIVTDPAPGAVNAMFKPVNDTLHAKWPGEAQFFLISQSFPSFLAWYDMFYDQGQAGGDTYLVSRLLDRATLTGNSTQRTKALMAPLPPLGQYSLYLVGGKGVMKAGGNSVNPAWRNTYVHSSK